MSTRSLRPSLILAGLLVAGPAIAHPGAGHVHGMAAGLAHPLSGLDHALAMVAVGLLAVVIGGRALWALPASFMGMMAVGAALGFAGVGLPLVETGIGLSVLVLGAALALGWAAPVALTAGLVAVFAVFHGQAHGAELPAGASAAGYAAGFLCATALLHVAGMGMGIAAGRIGAALSRVAGGAIALAGAGLLAGWI